MTKGIEIPKLKTPLSQAGLKDWLATFEREIKEKMAVPRHLLGGNDTTAASETMRKIKEVTNRQIDLLNAEHGG